MTPLASGDDMRRRPQRAVWPKGRLTDSSAQDEVRRFIGEVPVDGHYRDLLIEHLHKLNDEFGGLHERHLAALARGPRRAPREPGACV